MSNENQPYLKASLKTLALSSEEKEPYHVEIFDKRFVIYPNVHSPKYFPDTEFFVSELYVKEGEKFLEMGCGAGVITVFACIKGAKEVFALDINPDAVKNTGENSFFHGFGRKVKCLKSNLFSALKDEKFDTIFWNIPFWCIKRDNLSMLQRAIFDPDYRNFSKFIHDSKKFLAPKGKLLIGFSKEIGDFKKLKTILEKNNFSYKVISNSNRPITKNSAEIITLQLIEARPIHSKA